jgi:hypothetical protein
LREPIAAIGGMGRNNDFGVDKALKQLGELEEGHDTGKVFAMGSYAFCLPTKAANWITSQEVPAAGVFWDIFSDFVCMKSKIRQELVR